MHKITLFIFAAVFAVALAGPYYVPRAYYTIDAEGHESARVPLRRLRRSIQPYPVPYPVPPNPASGDANANAEAIATGGGTANANARAIAGNGGWGAPAPSSWGSGGWGVPAGSYGASNPALLKSGQTRRQYGPVQGSSISASTSVGVDSSGNGFYDQAASVNH